MIIDSHCHLNTEYFNDKIDKTIKNANNNNVNAFIVVGFDYQTNLKALELSKNYNNIFPTAGLHPADALKISNSDIDLYLKFIKENHDKLYAIGECGLDYYWNKEKHIQENIFRLQIELSITYNKPLIIHNREATLDIYNILKDYSNLKGVMHCFSSNYDMALKFIDLGFYISFAGPLTYKKNTELKEVAEKIDINKILIETDSPYLTPVPLRGEKNEPKNALLVLQELSKIRNEKINVLEEAIYLNTLKLFKIKEKLYEKSI